MNNKFYVSYVIEGNRFVSTYDIQHKSIIMQTLQDAYEISKAEYDFSIKTSVFIPSLNPADNHPWTPTQIPGQPTGTLSPGFDPRRMVLARHLELIWNIQQQGKNGQFALNISSMSGILTMLFELAIHHKLLNNNQNANVRVVDSIAANYWIESSQINRGAIDHFTTGTKDTLVLLFKKLETENTEHLEGQIDKLYFELKEILLEFKSIDVEADLPKELVSILEIVHLAVRPTSTHEEFVTLASEMANAGAK